MTDLNRGLSQREAEEKISRGEHNGGFTVRTKSVRRIFADNIFTLFNLINILIAFVVILVGAYRNTLFMGVVLSNTAIGIIQEIRSKRTIDRLSLISAPRAHLLRDGEEKILPVSDIVVGDIMLLSSGRQLCADAVLAEGEPEVDESLLTGESDTVTKHIGDKLYSGSFVVSGFAKAEVTAVGANAYANKIIGSAKRVGKRHSEMMSSINKIISTISICILPFALVLFSKALFSAQEGLQYSVTSTAAAIIGMIPEGLVLLTSIALAVSSIRLARRQTLCQDLYCVESLARVDVLCLDKTGTITTGNMQVSAVERLDKGFPAEDALSAFAAAMGGENSTSAAIAKAFPPKKQVKCLATEPFSSARKWSAAQLDGLGTIVLGAPSFVLPPDKYGEIDGICRKYAENGQRVLLLAQSDEPLTPRELPQALSARALVILSDEIRENAPKTISYFREQGVQLRVISGDDPITVSHVAEKAGLPNAENYVDLSLLPDEEINAAAEKYTVFGRVTPTRKLALVRALQGKGHKVAMTGDGVNDVLALREADCSIAMQSGSDAARCVSQLVLLNSDFSSMPLAVEEGRRCINNIQRSASLFLVKTVFSFLLALIFLFAPSAYPFQPIQLTLISALFIGAPSFLLALEPNHDRVKGSFIANVLKRALPGGLTVVAGISALLILQGIFGITQECLSTMAVFLTGAVCFGVLCGVCRPFRKRHIAMLIAVCAAFVFACILFSSLFYISRLSLNEWICVAIMIPAAAAVFLALTRLLKKIFSLRTRKKTSPQTGQTARPASAPPLSRLKGLAAAIVLSLSAIYGLWFGSAVTDYISLHRCGKAVFAIKQQDGTSRGIFYRIENNTLYIFGDYVPYSE